MGNRYAKVSPLNEVILRTHTMKFLTLQLYPWNVKVCTLFSFHSEIKQFIRLSFMYC